MYKGKSVGVVVPCYNEETQITRVLETMPELVDVTIVVDDRSTDRTVEIVERFIADNDASEWVVLIQLEKNQGVGRAISTGYHEALRRKIDVTAVMAGDAQMPAEELALIVDPVALDQADYAKANRLFYRGAWGTIPKHRFLGNSFLSMLTKIASGYWRSADSQTGFTAINHEALKLIDLDSFYPRYGYPNDMLVRLNVWDQRVVDVPTEPVYNVGEQSKMKIWKVVPTMSWLILKRFLWRMLHKYVIHDFHPLVLFYGLGATSFGGGSVLGLYLLSRRIATGMPIATTSAMFSTLLLMSGVQLLLFGMWFDMERNRELAIRYSRPRDLDPVALAKPRQLAPHTNQEAADDTVGQQVDEAAATAD